MSAAPFHDLIEESFDEAAFLWRRWETELTSLTRSLQEIYSWTEDRLHGALDGVRVGGPPAIEMATKELQSDEADRVTVATAILGSMAESGAPEAVASALKIAEGKKLEAMLRGLELLGSDQVLRTAASVLAAPVPAPAGALCRLKSFRRVAPGGELITAFKSNVADAQVEAMRAAWLTPAESAEQWITAALKSDDAAVRYHAAESGLYLRIDRAWKTITEMASQRMPAAGAYLKLLALFGTAEEQEGVYAALRVPELQVPAIWALGHIGSVRAADACVSGMQHEPIARACGEAYCWITGADLERDKLAAEEKPVDAPEFEDDDLEANLVPPPEALWPMPDAEAVKTHWLGLKATWPADVRHIRGQQVNGDTLLSAMETGPMIRRPDLALELRVKTRGRYDVEPRAFTGRQRQMMMASRAAVSAQDLIMLQLENQTPFKASIALLPDRTGIDTLYVIVKATVSLRPNLALAEVQLPPTLADEYHADPETSSLKYGSEMHIGKTGTDVIVIGSAWAPGGRPVPAHAGWPVGCGPTEDDPRHRRPRVARGEAIGSEALRVDATGVGAGVRRRASERRQGRSRGA